MKNKFLYFAVLVLMFVGCTSEKVSIDFLEMHVMDISGEEWKLMENNKNDGKIIFTYEDGDLKTVITDDFKVNVDRVEDFENGDYAIFGELNSTSKKRTNNVVV